MKKRKPRYTSVKAEPWVNPIDTFMELGKPEKAVVFGRVPRKLKEDVEKILKKRNLKWSKVLEGLLKRFLSEV